MVTGITLDTLGHNSTLITRKNSYRSIRTDERTAQVHIRCIFGCCLRLHQEHLAFVHHDRCTR